LVRMINYLDIYKNPTHELWAKKNLMEVSCPEDKKRIHNVQQGDMFFTPSSETTEDIGWSAVAMEDLPETVYSYHVIRFRSHEVIDLLFRRYWCNNVFVLNQFSQASRGTTRKILDRGDFRRIVCLVPPGAEQTSIGRFLDWANGRLDRAIQAKRKVIALLNEQKKAIIHRAVTRGLNPSVPLKPSGISWLGDIPQHWEVSRVKNEFHCLNKRRVPLNSVERGAMTSRIYDYYGASGVIDKVDDYLFDDELLLIAEDGANLVLRNLPLAIIARGKFWVNNHAHILKPKRGSIFYLSHILETLNYMPWISGAAQPKLTQDRLLSISIAVAPPEEQEMIVQHTSEQTQPLVTAISRLEREIELLREYHTRLVADVVTGKLDVREAAARLPEEAPLETVEDEIDPTEDPEAADEEIVA
jgi:type I restriction enzyme S subunit